MDLKPVHSGDKKAGRSPVDEEEYGKHISAVSILIKGYVSNVESNVYYLSLFQ